MPFPRQPPAAFHHDVGHPSECHAQRRVLPYPDITIDMTGTLRAGPASPLAFLKRKPSGMAIGVRAASSRGLSTVLRHAVHVGVRMAGPASRAGSAGGLCLCTTLHLFRLCSSASARSWPLQVPMPLARRQAFAAMEPGPIPTPTHPSPGRAAALAYVACASRRQSLSQPNPARPWPTG